jgi:hypothetical protein
MKSWSADVCKFGVSTDNARFRLEWDKIGKSLLLSFLVVASTYVLLAIVDWAFLLDARWWVFSLKLMNFARFVLFLKYLPAFLAYCLISSFILHGQFRLPEMGSEIKTTILWTAAYAFINVFGITLLIAWQEVYLHATEVLYIPLEALFTVIGFQFIPLLTLTAFFSTFFFRKTGNIYTGAFMNALFLTWYIVGNQAILWPRITA